MKRIFLSAFRLSVLGFIFSILIRISAKNKPYVSLKSIIVYIILFILLSLFFYYFEKKQKGQIDMKIKYLKFLKWIIFIIMPLTIYLSSYFLWDRIITSIILLVFAIVVISLDIIEKRQKGDK